MRKKCSYIFLLFIFIAININSVFANSNLDETQKYYTLCKVWGMLKYNHPEVRKGKIDWDKQLFIVLPKIENSTSKKEMNDVYLEWFSSLKNNFKASKIKRNKKNEIYLDNYNTSWINDSTIFTIEVSKYLNDVSQAKRKSKFFFAKRGKYAPFFPNEKIYNNTNFPDKQIRLLSLFRYWNIVEYFYAYKNESIENWDNSLLQLIPKFKNSSNFTEYHLSIREMIASINDSHAHFNSKSLNSYIGSYRMPFAIKVIDSTMYLKKYYTPNLNESNNIPLGAEIRDINGFTFQEIYSSKEHLISASNYQGKLILGRSMLFGSHKKNIKVSFINQAKELETVTVNQLTLDSLLAEIKTYKQTFDPVVKESFEIIDSSIAYVNMDKLKVNEIKNMMQEIISIDNMIIDLRSYPNGTIEELAKYLIPKGVPAKFLVPSIQNPGKYFWENSEAFGSKGEVYKGKIIVLVGHGSLSQSEFSTMILQMRKDVIVIGNQTAGADGAIAKIYFPSGEKSNISGFGVYYPNKSKTQRVGIKIDYIINPSINDIILGKDKVLEEAVKLIYNNN